MSINKRNDMILVGGGHGPVRKVIDDEGGGLRGGLAGGVLGWDGIERIRLVGGLIGLIG